MRYLLDTNACLDFLLARSDRLARRVEAAFGRLAISSITAAELFVGNRSSSDAAGDARRIDQFLAGVDVEPFELATAEVYGTIIRKAGMRRGSFDRLIAAQAVALDCTLVTNDLAHFADIAGLRVENWTLPQ